MLPFVPISNFDIQNAIKGLLTLKSVGPDGIPGFVIKSCSETLVPVLKLILNLSVPQNDFPNLWEQAAIFSL
jgi:hypothetical protein